MTTPARVAAAAVIGVLAVGGALFVLRPGDSSVGGPGPTPTPTSTPAASPTPSPSPVALHGGPLTAGTYVATPFAKAGSDACFVPPQPGCIDSTDDDAIRVTLTVPDGWTGGEDRGLADQFGPRRGRRPSLIFVRGASLYNDPCHTDSMAADTMPEIPVGPTVDDFVSAVATHPLLDVVAPTDVSLAGYTGKYLELQVPADISKCGVYRPWEPWYYAQGPGERWRLWVLDVGGVRVVVQGIDHAGTSTQRQTELQAIVDSIQIAP